MAGLAIDPGRRKIIRMRRIQPFGIYLMVAVAALDRKILYMHLMAKSDFTH